jgi:hypothetical protein
METDGNPQSPHKNVETNMADHKMQPHPRVSIQEHNGNFSRATSPYGNIWKPFLYKKG